MPDYFYDMDLVVDPLNPSNVVAMGQVAIYDPADTAGTTLLALKDPSGLPLPNPLTSNANGFLPPRIAQVPQTMWKSGGFVGYFNSFKGLRDEAVSAVAAAQGAADAATTAVAQVVTTAAVDGAGALVLTKANGSTVNAGNVKGGKGDKGDTGAPGVNGANVLPTQEAIEQAIINPGPAKAALTATIGDKVKPADALFTALDMRDPRALNVAIAGDSTGDAAMEWFETSWRELLAELWPERPARVLRWNKTGEVYDAPVSLQAGDSSLGMLTLYNASWAGGVLTSQQTRLDTMYPVKPDVLFINHGHNYTATNSGEVAGPFGFFTLIDQFEAAFQAKWPGTPFVVFSQNPEFVGTRTAYDVGRHATRQIALRGLTRSKGWGYIPGYEAFALRPDFGSPLLMADKLHPSPALADPTILTGGRLQAETAKRWMRAHTLRPVTLATTGGGEGPPVDPGAATYVYDTFTDTDGTALQSHTPEVGTTWTGGAGLITGGKLYASASLIARTQSGATDVSVEADITTPTSLTNFLGVAARTNSTGTTYLWAYFSSQNVILATTVNNAAAVTLATIASPEARAEGSTHKLRLTVVGNNCKVHVGDAQVINYTMTTGEAAGHAGLTYAGIRQFAATSTGVFDNFKVIQAS